MRLTSVIWPPKDVCVGVFQALIHLWMKSWEAVDLDATRKHDIEIKIMCVSENVYLCPCFCNATGTRPGTLLNWTCELLPLRSVPFIFDLCGTLSHLEIEAILNDRHGTWKASVHSSSWQVVRPSARMLPEPWRACQMLQCERHCTQVTLWGHWRQSCIYLLMWKYILFCVVVYIM